MTSNLKAAKVSRWDSAEYLKTEEDVQLYMEACLEEAGGGSEFIARAFSVVARAEVEGFTIKNDAFDRFTEACEEDSPPNKALSSEPLKIPHKFG